MVLTTLYFSVLDIRNWIRNIEQHASDNVNKILVGNKADMDESKRVGDHVHKLFIMRFASSGKSVGLVAL